MTVTTTFVHEGWTVQAHGRRVPQAVLHAQEAGGIAADAGPAGGIPATVPGSATTDLFAAGLIDDPYLDDNERLQAWIGVTDFTYRTTLDWTPDGNARQELIFEGLDTIAEIRLNGSLLASTRNMHRSYRLNVTGLLHEGSNELEVAFRSPVKEADAASLSLGYRPHANHHPYNAIRKMACGFGWDWGIDTSTSGIWRPVRLEGWSGARFGDVRVAGTLVDEVPTVVVAAEVVEASSAERLVRVSVGAVVTDIVLATGALLARAEIPIPDAALWWPRGHGDAALHDVTVELLEAKDKNLHRLDTVDRRIGFRSVELVMDPDDAGVGFEIRINGRTIQVRGANWIPDDAFPHRVDRARYANRLEHAEYAGINLIRVWGGGIYEADEFYEECDARGILTWQDFLLACAGYAEEEPLRSEIEAEAREAVTRLGGHPSLVVLNGNNENIWGRQEWEWEGPLEGRTWGSGYYYELFPAIVAELAPHVAYTPGSPFSPDADDRQNAELTGTMHIWDLWNEVDYPHYRDYRPRFVAEFGWQGPPTWSTLLESVTDEPLTPESPGMQVHQKAIDGNRKLTASVVEHLTLPNEMADWHWAMSLNQANAVRTAIEWFRSLTPHCTGSIVWQLNDCWPVTSWAAVDGAGRRKPLLHALRHAHAERLLTVQPLGAGSAPSSADSAPAATGNPAASVAGSAGLEIVALNDTDAPWAGDLIVERVRYDGSVVASAVVAVTVEPRGVLRREVDQLSFGLGAPSSPESELLVARLGDAISTAAASSAATGTGTGTGTATGSGPAAAATAHWFFAEPRDAALESPRFEVDAQRTHDGWTIDVTAQVLVRDVTLLVDRIEKDAVVDGGLETLLPGETARFVVRGAVDADPVAFADAAVLRSANDLIGGGINR